MGEQLAAIAEDAFAEEFDIFFQNKPQYSYTWSGVPIYVLFFYILNNTLINMLRTNTLDTFNAYNPVLLAKKSF